MDPLDLFGGEEVGQGAESAPLVVLPFGLEHTVSYGGGTARGPSAILRASAELEFIDEETCCEYWPQGAVRTLAAPDIPRDTERALQCLADTTIPLFTSGQFVLTLGGEHSLTSACVNAATRGTDGETADVGVLFFDAHLDLRDQYQGTPWSHACVARRVLDAGHPVEWCGTRSISAEELAYIREHDLAPYFAHEIAGDDEWIEDLVERLPDKVYLSIDVDGLDPSVVPGTGTPEPGGLSYRTLIRLVRRLFAQRRVLGADIVEVAPIAGQLISEFTAAKIAAKVLGCAAHQAT